MSKVILLVEDETVLRETVAGLLEDEGFEVIQAADGRVARDSLLEKPVDIVLSDIRMPEMDGLQLLSHVRRIAPETPVILITAFGTVDSAVQAMREGAWDYLLKPVQFDDLLTKLRRALEFREMYRERNLMTEQLAEEGSFHNLITDTPSMVTMFEQIRKLSEVRSSVLIIGESGTGKELVAKAIHYNGESRNKRFVAVNCGAIPETLIEAEMFGYRKGAFTGATRDKVGYFEAADNGTIFLDEISALPLSAQATLLRVLEDRMVIPVGDTRPRRIDVRVVAATNEDIDSLVAAKEFRTDLLFRLDVVRLKIPPLRERKRDIPLLVHHFLQKFSTEMARIAPGVSNTAMQCLLAHEWPGNIRELQNIIERAVIFSDGGVVDVGDLPFVPCETSESEAEDLKESIQRFERQHIISSLERHHFDKAETAKHLHIGLSSLYRKMEDYEIPKQHPDSES